MIKINRKSYLYFSKYSFRYWLCLVLLSSLFSACSQNNQDIAAQNPSGTQTTQNEDLSDSQDNILDNSQTTTQRNAEDGISTSAQIRNPRNEQVNQQNRPSVYSQIDEESRNSANRNPSDAEIATLTDLAITEYEFEHCQPQVDNQYYASGYDPLIDYQWYLDAANIKQAWRINPAQGEGIEIAVIDGGVQLDHEDLAANIIQDAGVNVLVKPNNFYRNFPYAQDCAKDRHGTAVAGIIAAVGDNGRGIKGIAPKAKIWVSNLVAKRRIEAEDIIRTFTNRIAQTAVSSNSWTSSMEGLLVKANPLFYQLIDRGLQDGFYGKGTSYVFAAGNSGANGDMATHWEVLNHKGIIVVCAVGEDGDLASFSETGANLWVCAPSSSGGNIEDIAESIYDNTNPAYLKGYGLPTLDISGTGGYNTFNEESYLPLTGVSNPEECQSPVVHNLKYDPRNIQFGRPGIHQTECPEGTGKFDFSWTAGATNSYNRFFGGTSAAVPVVSGIIALIRSAYPDLTWRDIRLILAESAKMPPHAFSESQIGALSYHDTSRFYAHHTRYGFGVVDATDALILAEEWNKQLPDEIIYQIPQSDYLATPYIDVSANTSISFIESLYIEMAPTAYNEVNNLSIKLRSPNGVESTLTRPSACPITQVGDGENFAKCQEFVDGFTFSSSAHLGENPAGTWHLEITQADIPITDFEWRLVFHGH